MIGVKPSRLLATSDRTTGRLLFVDKQDAQSNTQQLVCHELTHACAIHLVLPAWLNEGIAMLTVDRFLGRRTVRAETLDLLRAQPPRRPPPGYHQLTLLDAKSLALQVVRGYWLVDLLEQTEPDFLKRRFASRADVATIERETAGLLGLPVERFWQLVDDLILSGK